MTAVTLAGAAALPATAAAQSRIHIGRHTPAAHAAGARPTVALGNTLAGPLLVDHRGYTIFMFAKDARNRDNCAKIKGCLTDWPAVTTTGRPNVGPGLKRSLVGTIPYKGKLRMVTYDGRPLHTYKFDPAPKSVENIGNTQFGGAWWALNAAGKPVK